MKNRLGRLSQPFETSKVVFNYCFEIKQFNMFYFKLIKNQFGII